LPEESRITAATHVGSVVAVIAGSVIWTSDNGPDWEDGPFFAAGTPQEQHRIAAKIERRNTFGFIAPPFFDFMDAGDSLLVQDISECN
jgi:hypothetical protein